MSNAKLIVVLTIILIGVGAYFLFFSENEFDSKNAELNSIWLEQGIDIENIDFDEGSEIIGLQPFQVEELKNKLASKKSSLGSSDSSNALKKLIDIQVNNLEVVEKLRQFYSDSLSIDFSETDYASFCGEARNDYSEVVNEAESLVQLINENNSLIKSFNSNYLKEFGVSARNLDFDVSGLENELERLKEVGEDFDELCA